MQKLSCFWIGRLNIKMFTLSKAIYRFSATLSKNLWQSPQMYKKMMLKFIWAHKRTQIAKATKKQKQILRYPDTRLSEHSTR